MYQVLIVAYLLVALALIGLVLIQQGKGADMGASFGAGASNTVFGSSGAGNFLTRSTAILAAAFIIISLILGNLSANQNKGGTDKWSDIGKEQTVATEATTESVAELPASEKAANATELPAADNTVAPESQGLPASDDAKNNSASESDLPK